MVGASSDQVRPPRGRAPSGPSATVRRRRRRRRPPVHASIDEARDGRGLRLRPRRRRRRHLRRDPRRAALEQPRGRQAPPSTFRARPPRRLGRAAGARSARRAQRRRLRRGRRRRLVYDRDVLRVSFEQAEFSIVEGRSTTRRSPRPLRRHSDREVTVAYSTEDLTAMASTTAATPPAAAAPRTWPRRRPAATEQTSGLATPPGDLRHLYVASSTTPASRSRSVRLSSPPRAPHLPC